MLDSPGQVADTHNKCKLRGAAAHLMRLLAAGKANPVLMQSMPSEGETA